MTQIYQFFKIHGLVVELVASVAMFTWHLPRRNQFWFKVAGFVFSLLVVSLAWNMIPEQNVAIRSVRYFVMMSLCICGIRVCCEADWDCAMFFGIAAGTVQHMVFKGASTLEFCTVLFFGANWWSDTLAYPTFVPLLYALCYCLFARRVIRLGSVSFKFWELSVLFAGVLLSFGLYQNLLDKFYAVIGWQMYLVFDLLDISICLFLLLLLISVYKQRMAENNSQILQQLLYQQKEQLKTSREMVDLINIKCHDIKNQIASLGSRIPQDEIDNLNRAITIYDAVAHTGNEALDVLLTEKSLLCAQKTIQFDYMVDDDALTFMVPSDVYALFGNALDNAIEASYKIEDTDCRYIGMKIRHERGMAVIHIENNIEGSLVFEDGLPRTTKEDARYHGFGMKSIRLIVEKYNGFLSAREKNGLFSLDIIIPCPAE